MVIISEICGVVLSTRTMISVIRTWPSQTFHDAIHLNLPRDPRPDNASRASFMEIKRDTFNLEKQTPKGRKEMQADLSPHLVFSLLLSCICMCIRPIAVA